MTDKKASFPLSDTQKDVLRDLARGLRLAAEEAEKNEFGQYRIFYPDGRPCCAFGVALSHAGLDDYELLDWIRMEAPDNSNAEALGYLLDHYSDEWMHDEDRDPYAPWNHYPAELGPLYETAIDISDANDRGEWDALPELLLRAAAYASLAANGFDLSKVRMAEIS